MPLKIPMNDENPLSFLHFRLLRIFLWVLGLWPDEVFGQKVSLFVKYMRIHLPTQAIICIYGTIYYLVQYHKILDFSIITDVCLASFLAFLTATRGALASLKNYGVIFHNFFTSFHLFHFRHKSEYFMKMYSTVHKISHYFTLYLVSMSVVALLFFNLPSLYSNYEQGTFTERREDVKPSFAIYFEFPGMKQEDYLISLTVLNFWLSYSCSISVCLTDLILVLMVMQIIGHILVLNYNILNLPKPKKQTILRGVGRGNGHESQCYVELYDDEENADIHRRIGEFVKHHLFIVSFTDKVSEFFGLILALNYAFHLCSCCLLLLQCLGGNPQALARFGTIAVVIFGELIYTSVIFEVVGTVSEKLKDSVYEVPWECMNLSNQLSVCILLRRVQTPIHVTAMSLTVVGVQTMAKILKTTLSYFAFLRTMG